MARTKQRKKILHQPGTHEIFVCLQDMPDYSRILIDNSTDKKFTPFLKWLIDIDFYRNENEKTSIKKLATEFKADSSKVTKWLNEIYDEIFILNDEKPGMFQKSGVKVSFYIKSYDNSCTFSTTVNVLPRLFETIRFPFVQGKVGMDYFWVKKVEHAIQENKNSTTVWLEGGFVNMYREFLLDRALFYGEIGMMDEFQKHPFEIDEMLKAVYRH